MNAPVSTRGFALQTGPNHPGAIMWVSDISYILDMTPRFSDARIFGTAAAAKRAAKSYSALYDLRVVPGPPPESGT